MKEQWVLVNKQADFARLAAKYNVPPLVVKLMINRGIAEDGMKEYLSGGLESLCEPSLMKDIDKAAEILLETVQNGEQTAIVTDYDCDGVFSGMVLYTGLTRIGAVPKVYTPDRIAEGYGINKRIVDEIYNSGINYIITCDNGIAAKEEIEYAKSLGMKVIITDHHEVPFTETENGRQYILPNADAVCDPKQEDCKYPYKGLCGAGVAYKLIEVLYRLSGIDAHEMQPLLEFTAIATVADIMELTDENRIIVKEGLKLLSGTKNPGLRAIKKVNALDGRFMSAYHIGFVLGPCFNAAGRLGSAALAFELLMEQDEKKALSIANTLKDLNDERKEMTEEGAVRGNAMAAESEYASDKVLVLILPDCHESLAGIIAGRIKDNFHKPTIVFTETENGLVKGSGRSIPAYSMYEELSKCKELFTRFGGHAMAAGITMPGDKLDELRSRLNEYTTLTDKDFIPNVYLDAEVLVQHMSEPVVKSLSVLEPFGNGNRKPVFAGRHFDVLRAQIIGKNKNVLKLFLKDVAGSKIAAVCFQNAEGFLDMVEDEYGSDEKEKMLRGAENCVDVALTFYPEINEYNGLRSVQLIIQNYCIIRR